MLTSYYPYVTIQRHGWLHHAVKKLLIVKGWEVVSAPENFIQSERPDGKDDNIGVVSLREALNIAADRGLDLVEVAPNANPPVCRVMDFSKFLYEKSKREREARKAQKTIEVKEIQLQLRTNEYHLGFKVRDARRWLGEGMKVKVRVIFHGREITYPELARDQLDAIATSLQDVAIIEQPPKMDGKAMMMTLAPASLKEVKEPKPEVKEPNKDKDREKRNPK
jgi:translation initiation factor IF-3